MRVNGNGSGNGNGNRKPPVLVVVQQSGGNDFMNTLVPYTNGVYYDSRPAVRIPEDKVLPINDTLGFHPQAAVFKEMYDGGNVAIIQGIGYRDSNRSHFRGMDIMHTCEPDRLVYEGWLGKAIRALDPKGENVLTGVNFGRGLPRAMAAKDVPVTSIGNLDSYGLMTPIAEETQRNEAMGVFKDMYAPAIGTGPVLDYIRQTVVNVMGGADVIKDVPGQYTSQVEYAANPIAQSLEGCRTRASGRPRGRGSSTSSTVAPGGMTPTRTSCRPTRPCGPICPRRSWTSSRTSATMKPPNRS